MMVVYITFGYLCISFYGSALDGVPVITSKFPHTFVAYSVKIAFCINLVFSYPLMLYPVNNILESYIFKGWKKSSKRHYLKNCSRTVLVAFTVGFTLLLGQKINQFISILGALTCTPLAFTLPAYFHLKTCALTDREKNIDKLIIVFSFFILVFATTMGVLNWSE